MHIRDDTNIRARRECLKLSREKLARQVEPPCAAITIAVLEGGWRPRESKVLAALIATLDRLESAPVNSIAPADKAEATRTGRRARHARV